jgi:hypothetical protein
MLLESGDACGGSTLLRASKMNDQYRLPVLFRDYQVRVSKSFLKTLPGGLPY